MTMQNHNLLPAPKVGKEINYNLISELNAPITPNNSFTHADYQREWAKKYHLEAILNAINIKSLPKNCEILEVGAQTQDIAREIIRLALKEGIRKVRYTALDIIQRFEPNWKPTPDYIYTRLRPIICDAHNLGDEGYLHNEQFDIVASYNALYSMTDSGEILNRMWERTKPGGYILLSSFDSPRYFYDIPILLPAQTTQETHLAFTRKNFGFSWPRSYSLAHELMTHITQSTKLGELTTSGFDHIKLRELAEEFDFPYGFAIPLYIWLEYLGIRHEVIHEEKGPTLIKIFKDTEHASIIPQDIQKAPYITSDVTRRQYPFLRILNVAPDSFVEWLMEKDKLENI